MAFTSSQTKAMVLVPKFPAFLSTMASSWVVWQVARDRRKHRSAYHRIVLGLSCWDVWFSLSCFLSSWPMPVGSQYYAVGNQATCVVQGWSQVVSLATIFYSCVQAAYYTATIRYGLSEREFALKYERPCHALANLIPLLLATPGLVPGLDLYNPSGPWCFIASYPSGCIQSYQNKGPTTCTRGDNSYLYRFALFYVPLWAGILFNVVAMALIYHKVRSIEAKSQRWSSSSNKNKNKKSRAVAHQAFFYILAFFLTWTLPTVNRMLAFAGVSSFGVTIGHVLSSPSQGIFNFLCYVRPRYLRRLRDLQRTKSSALGTSISSFGQSALSFFHSTTTTTTTTTVHDNSALEPNPHNLPAPLAPEDDGESSSFFHKCQAMYQTMQTLGNLEQDDFDDIVSDHPNDTPPFQEEGNENNYREEGLDPSTDALGQE